MKSKVASNRDKLSAAVEMLNRSIGTPGASDVLARIEEIEKRLEQTNEHQRTN